MVAEVVVLLEKNLVVLIFLVGLVDQAVVVLAEHELMELQDQLILAAVEVAEVISLVLNKVLMVVQVKL
jgi:hypothetical protein